VLTADLVTARRRGDELQVPPLDADDRARVEELAGVYLEIARAHVGRSREELEGTWRAVALAPRERRLADGVLKLVNDRCVFETAAAIDPAALRAQVFLRAAAARRAADGDGGIDRAAILTAVASAHAVSSEELERLLYADLHGAERLCSVTVFRPAHLAAGFDLAQMQAVLLRATKVVAEVASSDVGAYRRLFHKLKFLRLLHAISATKTGYRVEIDGPFSLFQAVTRYGLQLAMALPAIAACGRWRIEADVLWGKERRPVTFRAGGGEGVAGERTSGPARTAATPNPPLSEEVATLLERLAARESARESGWTVAPATAILDLPGAGICVPDLVFTRGKGKGDATRSSSRASSRATPPVQVYLEVMGFWSREAVWRRVELIERGLPHRILFAVSKHLRVSEAVLGDDLPGSLYVYARALEPRAILERVEHLAARPLP
jgi:predicted nuclease of restriction endonuclease-like RecB superfamily